MRVNVLQLTMNSRRKAGTNWLSASESKDDTVFMYLSYDNGRVYSFPKKNSGDVSFNDKNNTIRYKWSGEYVYERLGYMKTVFKKLVFRIKIESVSEYDKIKSMFST